MTIKKSLIALYYRFGTTNEQKARIEQIMANRYGEIPAEKSKLCSHLGYLHIFVKQVEDTKRYNRQQMHTIQIDRRDIDMAVRLERGWYGDTDQIENADAKLMRRGTCYIAEANGHRRMAAHAVTALLKCYGVY